MKRKVLFLSKYPEKCKAFFPMNLPCGLPQGRFIKIYTYSAKETIALGKKFSRNLKEKDVVVFEGALGGGKTTFIKGILRGLSIRKKVLSPSFTLVREYANCKLCIYHIDLYRIEKPQMNSLGLDDFLYAKASMSLIEWGEKIEGCLPAYIKVEFYIAGENKRKINFSLKGYPKRKISL